MASWLCAVEDEVIENVALNKPVYRTASSTADSASAANDGDKTQCLTLDTSTNPWLAVDLGADTSVFQVNFLPSSTDGTYFFLCQ